MKLTHRIKRWYLNNNLRWWEKYIRGRQREKAVANQAIDHGRKMIAAMHIRIAQIR